MATHRLSGLLLVIALSFYFYTLAVPHPAFSAGGEDAKKQYEKVQEDIKRQEEKIERAKRAEGATLDDLDRVNRELNGVSDRLRATRSRLKGTEDEVRKTEAQIGDLTARIEGRKEWIKRRLRAMHRYGRYGDTLYLLGTAGDFTQLIRRWRYLEILASYEHKQMDGLRADVAVLKAKEEALASLRARLEAETGEVERTKRELAGSRQRKEEVLASIKRETAQHKKMLRELREASRKLMEMLKESEGTSEFAGKGFRGLKGRLPWPAQGKVTVPYGTTEDPRFKTPVFRNGIYIATGEGASARAVHRGEVVFADWFKGYGRLVVLNHGDGYHSLYANLSEIFLKPGDIIENMGEIGKVGESGLLNRASLYFEIRYKGKALDPVQWLKRKSD